jgi:hypothetical protein
MAPSCGVCSKSILFRKQFEIKHLIGTVEITQNLVKFILASIWQLLAEHFIKGCVLVSMSEYFFLCCQRSHQIS